MKVETALELRDQLLSELDYVAQSAGDSDSADLPSLGVYCAQDSGWDGGYGLSILMPDDQREKLHDWERETVDRAGGEANIAVVGPFEAFDCPRPAHLTPGCSISDHTVSAGTLGGFVDAGGTRGILSCEHVLGGHQPVQSGDAVYHPAVMDAGGSHVAFGELIAFSGLTSGSAPNAVDAAVASYDPDRFAPDWPKPGDAGYITGVTAEPDPTEEHEKVGRSTGTTRGRLTRFGHVARIHYPHLGSRLLFQGILVFERPDGSPMSKPGDSGSIIYGTNSRKACGLLFAGSAASSYGRATTLANPLTDVLNILNVELLFE